jgi:hypothetical protein
VIFRVERHALTHIIKFHAWYAACVITNWTLTSSLPGVHDLDFQHIAAMPKSSRLEVFDMPEQETLERAHEDEREGKSPSTQAGEFVREEMHHVREGKHGARSSKQAVAIGLSKARRSGVKLRQPARGKVSERTRKQAKRDAQRGQRRGKRKTSRRRSRAVLGALKRERHGAASKKALSRQGRAAARGRSRASRSAAAKKAARTRARNRRTK